MKRRRNEFIFSIIGLCLILFFVFFIFRARNNIEQYSITKEEKIYYYIDDYRNDYNGKIVLDQNDNISELLEIESSLKDIEEPIYFVNQKKVLFPNNMSIIRPTLGFKQNKLIYFTTLTKTDTYPILKNKGVETDITNAFIYDGVNTYFFIDKTVLKYDGNIVELSPFSYVRCSYKDYLYIYDYDTDSLTAIKDVDYIVYAESNGYEINLSTDSLKIGDQSFILAKNIEKLPNLK